MTSQASPSTAIWMQWSCFFPQAIVVYREPSELKQRLMVRFVDEYSLRQGSYSNVSNWILGILYQFWEYHLVICCFCQIVLTIDGAVRAGGVSKGWAWSLSKIGFLQIFLDFSTFLLIPFLQQQQQIFVVQGNVVIYWFLQLSSCFIKSCKSLAILSMCNLNHH